MGLLERIRKGTAVYWQRTGFDSYGVPTFAAPVSIDVRWEDKTTRFVDPQGAEKITSAVVYVGVDIEPGSYLKNGTDPSPVLNPREDANAEEVKQFSKTPNLRYTKFIRIVYI